MEDTNIDAQMKEKEDTPSTDIKLSNENSNNKNENETSTNDETCGSVSLQTGLDSLGLLAEAVCRDRNDSDDDIEPEDEEAHTPGSVHTPDSNHPDERDNDSENEQQDYSNIDQNNSDEHDDEIDINDDFVLRYESSDEKEPENNEIDTQSGSQNNPPDADFSTDNIIMNVVSLATKKDKETYGTINDKDATDDIPVIPETTDADISKPSSSEQMDIEINNLPENIPKETINEKNISIDNRNTIEATKEDLEKLNNELNMAIEILNDQNKPDNADPMNSLENVDKKILDKDGVPMDTDEIKDSTDNATTQIDAINDTPIMDDIMQIQVGLAELKNIISSTAEVTPPTNQNEEIADIEVIDLSDDEISQKDKATPDTKGESPKEIVKPKLRKSEKILRPNRPVVDKSPKTAQVLLDIVDLDESSSESDEANKKKKVTSNTEAEPMEGTVTVCIPSAIEVTSISGQTQPSIISCDNNSGASVISGLPALCPKQTAAMRINTAEITISTVQRNVETNMEEDSEIFTLDSDEDEPERPAELLPIPPDNDKMETESLPIENIIQTDNKDTKEIVAPPNGLCINPNCKNEASDDYTPCPLFILGMYKVKKIKRDNHPKICNACREMTIKETEQLINKFTNRISLINTDMTYNEDPVEVLDSDSDGDDNDCDEYLSYSVCSPLPDDEIDHISKNLSSVMEEVCLKYNFDKQIDLCSEVIMNGVKKLEDETLELQREIDALHENTARIRTELYEKIQIKRQFMPERIIPSEFNEDDPENKSYNKTLYSTYNKDEANFENDGVSTQPLCTEAVENSKSLPPRGHLMLNPLDVGNMVYTVKKSIFGAWIPSVVIEISPAGTPMSNGMSLIFSLLTVRYFVNGRQATKQVTGRQVAYFEPAKVRYPIGTRVIALFKDLVTLVKKDAYYSGVIAESPSVINKFRYLVFFDDGYSQYVTHKGILPVSERSENVWDDVHPDSKNFVKQYLNTYPDRPMVRMQPGQIIRTEKNGAWWDARVIELDASLALLRFQAAKTREEWIYRGSTRISILYQQLQVAGRRAHAPGRHHRPTGATVNRPSTAKSSDVPYVEYTRSYDQDGEPKRPEESSQVGSRPRPEKPQRAVARKSTASNQKCEDLTPEVMDAGGNQVKSRVVYYSPKVWIHPEKMVPHACSPKCLNPKTLPLSELRTYNPLARPLLSAWERLIIRYRQKKIVMYRSPCGRRIRNIQELHKYLCLTKSPMSVDLFDFDHRVHCLAEFVLIKCFVSKADISHGVEAVPVPCVNYYDHSLPEFWCYSTQRQPIKEVDLNLSEDYLCACDCTDDCQDKEKCQCWQLTFEGARYVGYDLNRIGYQYKRLMEPCPTGIYECNSRCKCRATCLNKVVQHPLQLKLQVFKTYNKGWGIKALNDIPKGTFICIYAGNLLTDAVANMDGGINEGDKYLADLDYIEVVERLKENYESDVPEEDKILDDQSNQQSDEEEDEEYDSDGPERRRYESDDEFNPVCPIISTAFNPVKRILRPRNSRKSSNDDSSNSSSKMKSYKNIYENEKNMSKLNIGRDDNANKETIVSSPIQSAECSDEFKIKKEIDETDAGNSSNDNKNGKSCKTVDEDLITISDDEEVIREPSRFAAPEGFGDDEYVPRYKSVRSYYGEDEACFIMDARVRGNIGRYLNHSCSPNVFVQNVFVDTHDPRFPWVAFFALDHIRAGTELTWNYNYDVGSVPGKVIYCRCGASNCRGRLL